MRQPFTSIKEIAEGIASNGYWGKGSMKEGKRKWLKKDHDLLERYMTELGVPKEESDEYYMARHNLIEQINWTANQE